MIAHQLRAARRIESPCTIEIEHTHDHLHAHVELADGLEVGPGDKVTVHGAPIQIPFGEKCVFTRRATVERAGPVKRAITKLTARLELTELFEVSFSPTRSL